MHKFPHFPGGKHKSFRRSKFLDGTIKAYFAPGQKPNVADNDYQNPTDWNKAKSLLRVPQVVWLSCEVPDHYSDTYTQTFTRNAVSIATCNGNFTYYTGNACPQTILGVPTGNTVYPTRTTIINGGASSNGSVTYQISDGDLATYSGGPCNEVLEALAPYVTVSSGPASSEINYTTTIDNAYDKLYRQFHDTVFPAVKAAIESLRAQKTWVEILEFFDENGDSTYWGPEDGHTSTYTPLIAPTKYFPGNDSEDYFGVNFLHIYIGYVYEPVTGTQYMGESNDVIFQNAASSVIDAAKKFVGFTVKLYSILPQWDEYAPASNIPFISDVPDQPKLRQADDTNPPTNKMVNPWVPADPDTLASAKTAQQNAVSGFNDALISDVQHFRNNDNDNQGYLQTMANAFTGDTPPVIFVGDGTSLSSDDIVAAIRTHFKFDESGKDLAQ